MHCMKLSDISPMLRWSALPEVDLPRSALVFDEEGALDRLASDLMTSELRRGVRDVLIARNRPDLDLEDVFLEAYLVLAKRIAVNRGLAVPPRWRTTEDFGPWFRAVCRNATRDVLNQPAWQELDGLGDLPREPTDGQFGGFWGEQETSAHLSAYVDFLRELASQEGIRNPNWLLAHVALGLPKLLTKRLVIEAKRWRRGTTLHRPADATWTLLQWWSEKHALDPRGDEARRDLAWVLRSKDETGPARWADADQQAVSAARNLLQKWDGNARRNGVLDLRWPGYADAA